MIPKTSTEIVEDMFTYHPWNTEQIQYGTIVREILQKAYETILCNVPDCPDRDTALRKIREARMDCNSAITHNGKY